MTVAGGHQHSSLRLRVHWCMAAREQEWGEDVAEGCLAGCLSLFHEQWVLGSLWVLGQFGGKAALGKGLASSWPSSGLVPDQGMGATWGRVAQLHP